MSKRSIFDLDPEQLNQLLSIGKQASEAGQHTRSNSEPQAAEATSMNVFIEKPGDKIGRYKLLKVLGEGGMGMVYLAEQEGQIRRKVALKVIKPGMDSKHVIARFESERQALALLEHANIAQVYDAGTADTGRPYFVMEYVKGVPITEHCDRHKLTIEERLNLFLKVCEAVQHAHQKGIIHRDIKPSNILVSFEGQKAIPRIIDFGVAKAISQSLTERTLVTEQGQFIGTPEYMSPEQAEMTGQDIDTRTDIYSLGVVLYELLTGALPFDPRTLREGGFEHIRHMIREEDPKTPSTRLSTVSGEESTKAARLRRTDVRTLGRKLYGDLDWITIKAMEKDRIRRYQTAHSLGEDIQRHINNEPVLAGPPSKIYRLHKFILKHKSQAIGTAAVGILIGVIAIISVMYINEANRNKEADSLQHTNILSKAQEYRSKGQFQEALAQVETIVKSDYIGLQARLFRARIILELKGPAEAITHLEELTKEKDEIASQAHLLLARIYIETNPGDPETIQQYQQKAREHQHNGEQLFTKTAEAYFNRSMMAGTVNKTLEWLNEALDLDPGHYDSLEARALTYYALNEYDNMVDDASVMIGNKPENSKGYALRAIARRQNAIQLDKKKLFRQALADHKQAIRYSPEDAELYDQRRQSYMRIGDFKHALSDARKCTQLRPNKYFYHFNLFCTLTALGEYKKAQAIYDEVFKSKPGRRIQFYNWADKYVFDTLGANQSWHSPGSKPEGSAFLSMVVADKDYRRLVEKGIKRIVPEGFCPAWSPDGTRIVYSRGIIGYSGIETINIETGKTELLTIPGRDPAWSPDGSQIAFVRFRQTLPLTDLTAEYAERKPSHIQPEIWLIKADGSEEPRFLTKGSWPWWDRDGKEIYYTRDDQKLYAISIEEGSEPEQITWYPFGFPAISPESNHVAYKSYWSTPLRVIDVNTGSQTMSWTGLRGMLFINWSPDNQKLSICDGHGSDDGLWIYDMNNGQASQVLNVTGGITIGRWSPDGSKMALALGPKFFEIWIAETESLGPGLTLDEHIRQKIDNYPVKAQDYINRAKNNILRRERKKVLGDLKEYTDIVKKRSQYGKVPEDLKTFSYKQIIDPNDHNILSVAAWAYHAVAWCLVGRQHELFDLETAVELYQIAHNIQPKNWRYICGKGAAYYHMGQWEKAITELNESIKLDGGENGINYLFLAMSNWQLGYRVKAKELYNKAIELQESGNILENIERQLLCDIYFEATELMGIKPKEF